MEKPLWMICTTHLFIEVYLLIQVALIPVIVREFQLDLLEASLVATVPSLAALMMNIPSGYLADRFNTNHLLFASMVIEGVAALAISQTGSFWALVVGASFMRIASPIYHIAGLSQLSKLAQPNRISRTLGFHNAFGCIGSAAGLLTLTFFLSTAGWRWTYLFWSFPIITWGSILAFSPSVKTRQIRERTVSSGGNTSRLFKVFSPALLIFLVVIAIRELGGTGSSTFMTTYFVDVRNLPETTASLVFALGPAIGIFGSLSGGYFAERLGAKRALRWIILCSAVSLLTLSFVSQLYLLASVYLIYTLFSYAVWSPINAMVAGITTETERGLSYSLYFFTEGLMASIAPSLAAGAIELSGVWLILPLSVVFFIVSIMVLQFLSIFERRRGLEQVEPQLHA